MANEVKKNVANTKVEAAKKESTKRSNEDLKKSGVKGAITLAAKFAFTLGKNNKFAGVELDGRKPEYVTYPIVKNGGVIDRMDEKSEEFLKIRQAARLALPDLQGDQKYSANVKAFLKALLAVQLPYTRSLNNSILDGITL